MGKKHAANRASFIVHNEPVGGAASQLDYDKIVALQADLVAALARNGATWDATISTAVAALIAEVEDLHQQIAAL